MKVDHDEDKEGDPGFTFVVKKDDCIVVQHRSKLVGTLRGRAAVEFIDDIDGTDFDNRC